MLTDLSQLLNQPPGSLVYHLVTLFALQIIFGLALGVWRRDRQNRGAMRMMAASGGIFVMRLALLLAVILLDADSPLLLPLDYAADSVTAVLIVWALVPQSRQLPRLGDTLMAIGIFLILIMSAYVVQSGTAAGAMGLWMLLTLFVYGSGFIVLLFNHEKRTSLRTITLFVLLIAVAIGWVRLGYLVAFPLWAVLLYHETHRPPTSHSRSRRDGLTQALELSTAVILPTSKENILYHAIYLAAELTQSAFVGIITLDADEPSNLHLISNQPQIEENEPRQWTLNLSDWPAFRQVLSKQQPLELTLVGRGARQLGAWYQEMGLPALGGLLILPITAKGEAMGLLLFAGHADEGDHNEERNQLAMALATYIATAISNAERVQVAASALLDNDNFSALQDETAVSGQLITLEKERDDLEAYSQTLEARLQQTDQRLNDSSQRRQALTATLAVMEKHGHTVHTAELEDEIAALREALLDAEEALAMVAASETELSTEWVMLTITRYSGQLEEAHMQIQTLKNDLLEWEKSAGNQAALLLARELRAPITAVTGYTDLLLKEQAGIISEKQRNFLHNIQTNTERMAQLLAQLVQATADSRRLAETPQIALKVEDIIETAVGGILSQIRRKQLRFDCTIAPELPILPTAYHMLTSALDGLLEFSCQQADTKGRVYITATAHSIEEDAGKLSYLHLAIGGDGVGITAVDLPRIFDERGATPQLAMSRSLIEAKGGRLWVENDEDNGTVFSALLPLSNEQ